MTTDDLVIAELESAYREIRGTERSVRLSDRLADDLDIDSLGAVELLVDLEERFDVVLVGDPDVARVERVGELVAILQRKRADLERAA
jgi:acyl carrier protein